MLLFEKVTKKYDKDITALEDIEFNIDEGEFSFLVGPSGAGKTTILRLLIREELPTSGNILFEDIEVPVLPRKFLPAYRQRLGVVFQDIKLLPTKNLVENISFTLEILGKDRKEIKETLDYLLELVNLEDRRELFPHQLSGGEKQKAAIARALASSPDMLIADEPTGNLDPDNALEILNILKTINETGTTVFVISHDRDIVDKMKTRVIRLEDGKIISDTKGNYDSMEKPKKDKTKIKTRDSKKEIEEEKKEKKTQKKERKQKERDESLEGLHKRVVNKLLDANITNIELVLNLTDADLENLKLTKKEKKLLEKFVSKYLNSKEK